MRKHGILVLIVFSLLFSVCTSSPNTAPVVQKPETEQQVQQQIEVDNKANAEQAAIESANAAGVKPGDFDVDVTSSGDGISIIKYKGLATIVTIPSEIEGLPVKAISSSAFQGNKKIIEVVIPDGVFLYGRYDHHFRSSNYGIFADCIVLEKVTLPNDLKNIPPCLFDGCSSLREIIIPDTAVRLIQKNHPKNKIPYQILVILLIK
jgi:hypothetical protein